MNVIINSKTTEIPDDVRTVGQLLDHLRLPRQGTGVGINNTLVLTKNWDNTYLSPDDRIMIISAAFGG